MQECQDLKDAERSLRRAKSGENLVKVRSDIDVQNRSLCLEKGAMDKPTISQLVPSNVG